MNHPTSTLEHVLIFLKPMVDEHVFMDLVSVTQKKNPVLSNFEIWLNSACYWELVPPSLIGIISVLSTQIDDLQFLQHFQ